MARNKDFFVNSTPKRDRSFFVKEDAKKTDDLWVESTAPNVLQNEPKQQLPNALTLNPNVKRGTIQAPAKQTLGGEIGNFFKATLPQAAGDLWDDIKEPFVGKSERQLLTEAKLSPKLLVEDAKKQLAKENPTREDYALVKQTQDVIKKYGTDESNIRAISEDTTQLQKDLERAEKTWQASPVDAAVANTGAAVTGIFGNLGSFANSLGADKVPLLKEVTNFAVDGARKAQENAQQYNKGDYGEALGTVTQGVVNLVPYFLMGTGTAPVKGATTISKYGKYIEPIIKNPSFWYSLTSMWGQKYQEKLDEGYNRFQALSNAVLYALPASLIEVSGGIGAKGKEAQSLLRTIGEEIAEEIAQDIMSGVSDKATTNHDLPIFSMTEDAIINPKQLGKTALYTAPIVMIGGGANNIVNNSINNRVENQKAQAQINQDLQNLRNQNPQNVNSTIQRENVTGLPKLSTQNQAQIQNIEQPNVTLPTQVEMAQNANMNQIRDNTKLITQRDEQTLQSAKLAGMTDMDIQKAKELNDMLRSGTRLNFYDEKTIPQNVQADKAKIANGFYRDGTLWINKNSKNKVEQILGHELTHHLETTDSYTDLSNTILDSEVFYDFVAEKGYANVAEYKTKLKEMGYNDAQLDNELVARFVEEKMFTDQKSIDRLARQNTKLVEKIKNWISDLVVSFKGTAQEKELRRIENMYRKALDQARNSNATAETQYSIAGVKAMENINDAELTNAYNEAQRTGKNTRGWFKDKEGNWKFEFSDKDMTLKKNVRLSDKGNRLGDILEHDILFRAYPELRNTIVNFKEFKSGSGFFHKGTGEITLNKKLFNTQDWKKSVEASLLHEVQHAIQEIEGFSGAANPFWSKKAYYETLGEIEAADTKERFLKERAGTLDRNVTKPRSSEANPKHPRYDKYMQSRGIVDKAKDAIFPYYAGKGVRGYEVSEENTLENNKSDLRENDNRGLRRHVTDTAGKEPAFSMPETDNQGRTLSKEQQEFFKDSKVRDENGNLLVMYHGTPNEFTIFDIKKARPGTLGRGFYFTNSGSHAGQYGKQLEVYLNVKKPIQGDHTITENQLKNYLETLIEDDEYDIREYGYDATVDKVVKDLKGKSDFEILRDINTALIGDYVEAVKLFNEANGTNYDGIITNTETVVFTPNQIKNIDNTNPTENPDIRYSMNPVEVAKNPPNTKALSRYAQTLQNKHQDIPEQINLIQKEVDNGNFTHEVIHDKRSLNYAQKYIEENGFEDAVNHWNELIKRGKPVDKDELALGQTIYNVAVDNKDTKLVMKMASDLVQEYTEIGRNLQSATLLRKMTPDGRLYALERSVQKINQDLMQKFDDFENIQIPEELADELLRSETQKDMDAAVEKIQGYIASKIPATWQEKLNSWRYLAMLGNPRTHIRNIVGNAVFIPAVEMKNALAQVGELAISKDQRTKAFVTSLSKQDAKLLKYAENDFDKNQETIRGENKYDIKSGVQEKRTIYSNGALEAARKGNFKLLEAEDTLFLKFRYKKAFAAALKARGITIEQLRENSPETVRKVNEIRSYAINEAQKATYRDASKVASWFSENKRKLLNLASQSAGAGKLGWNIAYLGMEGVIPFTKTPINIVKRGIEYSPAGLLNGIKNAVFDVKSGKVTAAQAIDKIAAGATGTAIAGLGFFLASIGLVSGGEEEKDKEQALKQFKGNQDYALNIGNKSYTIDWSAPSSIPLFIGVELYNSITSEDESAYLNALSKMVEPVVEMSMLQGLNDTLTTLGEESAIGNIVGKSIMNYLGQYNPTLLGQIARSFDPVRRATYVDKNIPVPAPVQKFIQQQAAKIPGVSRMLPTYKDQFGQEQLTDGVINRIVQNFFSPGYLKDIKEGTVEQGLTELYEKTGETSVIPSYASKSLTHNGEKINLTAKQYDTYAKTRGDLSKRGLEGLFKDNYYKSLTDEQKIKVIEAIYDYATNIAKTKVIDDYELEYTDKKIQKLQSEGLDFYKYILLKKTADTDGNDYTSNDELDKAIKKYGLTRWQKTIKEKNTKTTKTTAKNTLPTLSSQRAKLPTLKK